MFFMALDLEIFVCHGWIRGVGWWCPFDFLWSLGVRCDVVESFISEW